MFLVVSVPSTWKRKDVRATTSIGAIHPRADIRGHALHKLGRYQRDTFPRVCPWDKRETTKHVQWSRFLSLCCASREGDVSTPTTAPQSIPTLPVRFGRGPILSHGSAEAIPQGGLGEFARWGSRGSVCSFLLVRLFVSAKLENLQHRNVSQ